MRIRALIRVKGFLDLYPEFIDVYQSLPMEGKEWLDRFCDTFDFGVLLDKFLEDQLKKNPPLTQAVSSFSSYAVFYAGSSKLMEKLVLEDAINLFSHRMGYLLVATGGQKLPRTSSITPMITNTELLIVMAWQEWREGRYKRVIGLLSNLSFEIDDQDSDPLYISLYVFLLLSSYISIRNLGEAAKWKGKTEKLLSYTKFKNNRFLSALLELVLGIWHNNFGNPLECRNYLESSRRKFEIFSNYYFSFFCGENLGLSYHNEKNYPKAYEIYYSILKKRDRVGTEELDPLHVYRVETKLANLSYDLGNIEDAITYAEEAIKLYKQFKIPSLESVFTLAEFYAVSGDITKARSILEEGIAVEWISLQSASESPDYFRVQGSIEKYACNFSIALEYFQEAAFRYRKSKDLNNFLECLAEIVILRLEMFFWRKQQMVLEQALEIADEFRSLVEGQQLVGWSYISKMMQGITRALAGRPEAIQHLKDAQASLDYDLFADEHMDLMKSIDFTGPAIIKDTAIKSIEFLTSILHIAQRDKWRIEERPTKLLYLLILDSESSLPVFVYYFDKEFKVDKILISGLISAMNTMSQSLELKELNEIRYRNTLVLVGHRNPLIFALVCDSEQTTVDLRIKILQLTEVFPRYTIGETRVDVGQMDFSESDELRSLVENIFLK